MKCRNCKWWDDYHHYCDVSGKNWEADHECSVEQDMEDSQ